MSKRGYLTGAEYAVVRQTLGFSQEEAAEFHKLQNRRTILRWERGDSWVSEIACDKIMSLFEKINWTIEQAMEKVEGLPPEDTEITLIIYPDKSYNKFIINGEGLPNSVHRAMVMRLFNVIYQQGFNVGIVEFNPQDYFSWLAAHGESDTQSNRSAWAVDYHQRLLKIDESSGSLN